MKKILLIFIIFFLLSAFVNASLVINEIMYNPPGADGGHEWIEIFNNGVDNVDMEGYIFFENDQNHRLNLVQGDSMVLPSSEYAVIADNAETFLQDYENYTGILIDSVFSLSNSGEYISLRDQDGNILDELEYSQDWGGNVNSLELINPMMDNNLSESWNSSLIEEGTPGLENSVYEGIMEDEIIPSQQIMLRQGWNLVSSYLIPHDLDLDEVFWFLNEANALEIVKNKNGNFYIPGEFDNIRAWNPYEAYYVKVNRASNLIISGEEVIDPRISLERGWNYMAYPLNKSYRMNEIISNVFEPLGDGMEMVKDDLGRFYYQRMNFSNMNWMSPGAGYMVKASRSITVDFSRMEN